MTQGTDTYMLFDVRKRRTEGGRGGGKQEENVTSKWTFHECVCVCVCVCE